MASAQPPVGIDLGTTFSVIARIDEAGRPATIPNAEGDLTTPSVVLLDRDEVVVGKEAVKAIASEAERIAIAPKREIGSRFFSRRFGDQQYAPEVIEAFILRKLVRDARQQIGDFDEVVITVPAYFDDVKRKATQDAGYMAGLKVLDIINEPTAAAVAYGFQQGFLSPRGTTATPQNVLVYDLGGGTFDVTVMRIEGNQFTSLAIDGDAQLGGQDWDQRLVDYVAQEFLRRHGQDPRREVAVAMRLLRDCEDAKRTLSLRKKATVACDFHGSVLPVEIDREKFEELTHDLLERTNFTTRQAIRAAQLDWGSVQRVLLVGGSSRMPAVRNMLQNLSGMPPSAAIGADEAVAHGAALRAAQIQAEREQRDVLFRIGNVNSHSLGIVGTDPHTGRKRNVVLIPRNTPLPVTVERTFRTQQINQATVLIQILEGEASVPEACTSVGQCVVRDLPANLPAGQPIHVKFSYRPDGRLEVHVAVSGTSIQLHNELQRENSLSQRELDTWRKKIAEL